MLVSDAFRELVGRHADFDGVAPASHVRVSWRGTPIAVHRLTGESRSSAMPRFAQHSPFVGRDSELGRLYAGWQEAREGAGVGIVISGEPGVGKSRLTMELRSKLAAEGVDWIEIRCLPEWQNGFLRPLGTLFVQMLGIASSTPVEGGVRVEEEVRAIRLNAAEAVPLLCGWLSLAMPDGYAPLVSSPQKQRQTLLEIVADVLIARLGRGAALLVEDLHWADPSTLDELDVIMQRSTKRPSFMVMTTRPRTRFAWTAEPRTIELEGLNDSAVKQLLAELLPTVSPADHAIADIVSRSDGLPSTSRSWPWPSGRAVRSGEP